MKKLLLISVLFFSVASLWAQLDTLLFQDFQDSITNELFFPDFDSIGTNNYINYDMDGKDDANSRPQNWYRSFDLVYITEDSTIYPAGDSNIVLTSSSWLSGFEDGNRNWFILPALEIVDDQATLYWKAAPRQLPRYMDGYTVRVSTTDFFPGDYDEDNLDEIFGEFSDSLFSAAQMIPPLPSTSGDPAGAALNIDSFLISPANGYVHGQRLTDSAYFYLQDGEDAYIGLLEPQAISLAAYEGETIYIAFIHDSDDDNLITIDDIFVEGTAEMVNNTQGPEESKFQLTTYPNPFNNFLILSYYLDQSTDVQIDIFDIEGRIVSSVAQSTAPQGRNIERMDLRSLPAGQYNVYLRAGDTQVVKKVVKW